ncbi:MAG: TonB family protein [Chlorobi bacterium]|nr:TonB family protein [Chlorobiota bacterium]
MKNVLFTILIFASVFTTRLFSQNNSEKHFTWDVYDVVDKKPRLEGFKHNIDKYFEKYRRYPDDAYMKGKEGKVFISFVVTKAGDVEDLSISQTTDNIFNAEAVRLIKNTSGHWIPGEKDGKVVNTRMVVPVRFELSDKDREVVKLLASFDDTKGKPLFVLDEKIVNGIVEIEDYNIQSVRVLKGEKATKLYGEKGKNGVVVITTKNGVQPIYKLR